MAGQTLILLSCSRDKRAGGTTFDRHSRRLPSSEALPREGKNLLAGRTAVFDLLHGRSGHLYDEEQKGGYRDKRKSNRSLKRGPDFGSDVATGEIYLPAYQRYGGRFFSEIEMEAPSFWEEIQNHSVEVLFLSGLYGLLFWDELIQEYDCHLSDSVTNPGKDQLSVDASTRYTRTLKDIWSGVLTDALCDFIRSQADSAQPLRYVYDLLSEEVYQEAFDWKGIASCGVKVRHRIFKGVAGPDILPYVAQILATQLSRFCEGRGQFACNTWYDCPGDVGGLLRFGFEESLGRCPVATREGEVDKARDFLLREYPQLGTLSIPVLDSFVLAEHSWRKVERLKRFDFGAIIVSFAKAVEHYLREVVLGCTPDGTIGQVIEHIERRRMQDWMVLCGELRELNRLRGTSGAHPGRRNKADVKRARYLALEIASGGEMIRSRHKRSQ